MYDYEVIKTCFSYIKTFAQREYENTILMHFDVILKLLAF